MLGWESYAPSQGILERPGIYLLSLDIEGEPSKGTVNCYIPHRYWLSSTEHNGLLLGSNVAIPLAGEKGSTHCLRTHTVQIDGGSSTGKGTRAPP